MAGMSPHEVCRIMRSRVENGFRVLQEFSFLTDHSMHMRMSIMNDDGTLESLAGWQRTPHQWSSYEKLQAVIALKEKQGWTVVWGQSCGRDPSIDEYLQVIAW